MPIPLIVGSLLGTLAKNGLDILSRVIQKKGKEFIEEKTGVDLSSSELSNEQILVLKQYEMEHEEELLKTALEDKKLDIEQEEMYLEDKQSARKMQRTALEQEDTFAKRFVYYYAIGSTFTAFLYFFLITFITIPDKNIRFADVILGFMLGTLITSIIQFFYGSSQGSKDKDKIAINSTKEGTRGVIEAVRSKLKM